MIESLTFISYCYNRDRFPATPVEHYSPYFPNVAEMEVRYQAERAIGKAQATAFVEWAFGERA